MTNRLFGPLLFALILLADQVSKWLVLDQLWQEPFIPVTAFFNLVLVGNRGISFGMFNGGAEHSRWILIGVALLIGAGLLVWLWREPRLRPRLAIVAVLAGAVGNLIDRFRFGFVIDFLDFHLQGYHWPAFNVADSAIVVGALVLVLDGLTRGRPSMDKAEGKG